MQQKLDIKVNPCNEGDYAKKHMNKPDMVGKPVSIIGLGYVGFPLACACAESKCNIYGVDTDPKKVNLINRGICPIYDNILQNNFNNARFPATSDFSVVGRSDIVVVCVPTPVDAHHNPDFLPLENASRAILPFLKKGHLIIIESTVNPGACEEVVQPILEQSGLKAGKDFDIAHCPERIDPGNPTWTVKTIPRVVGATTPEGLQKALDFYRGILDAEIIPMNSIKEAEATKIMENSFRDINIAFVNELAKSFSVMGIDVVRVIKAASTKPYSFLAHFPGCGVGGHCIPVDPYYLIKKAKKNGFNHRLLQAAREINESMPAYTVNLLIEEFEKLRIPLKKVKIGILGIAFKPDVADTRESPAFKIIKFLSEKGAALNIFDPLIKEKSTVGSVEEIIDNSDALILITSHKEFLNMDMERLKKSGIKVIIDGRNCLDKEKILSMGIVYRGIGR